MKAGDVVRRFRHWHATRTCGISCTPVSGRNYHSSSLERRTVTRVLHAFNRFFARVYHHIDVLGGGPRLPRKGAAILVCNHVSGLDPLLIQSVCPRVVVWMMA